MLYMYSIAHRWSQATLLGATRLWVLTYFELLGIGVGKRSGDSPCRFAACDLQGPDFRTFPAVRTRDDWWG